MMRNVVIHLLYQWLLNLMHVQMLICLITSTGMLSSKESCLSRASQGCGARNFPQYGWHRRGCKHSKMCILQVVYYSVYVWWAYACVCVVAVMVALVIVHQMLED